MPSNISEFIKETNAEIAKLQAKQVSEAKKLVLTTYTLITDHVSTGGLSPADTGLFRHNNFLTVNSKTNKTTEEPHSEVIEGGKENIDNCKFKHNDKLTIQNNLVYADRIEAGWSKQAPNGVYGVAEEIMRKQVNKRIKIK